MSKLIIYQSHVNRIALKIGCRLVQLDNVIPMHYVEHGYVQGPPIRNQIDYVTMLHELGHFFLGHTQGRPPHHDKKYYFVNGVLRSEAQAWEFALVHAATIEPLLPQTRRAMDEAIKSYYIAWMNAKGNMTRITDKGDRHYVEFVYDEPDRYFCDVVKKIRGEMK
jgi:hypothetical protein